MKLIKVIGYTLLMLVLLVGPVTAGDDANPGDIVINEIMQNPAAVSDSNGEWFEIYNATGSTINIDGWTMQDDGSDSHVIDNGGTLNVAAGDYFVLCNNGNSGTNGGVTCDYVFPSNWYIGNGADEIVLIDDGTVPEEIDRVEYDGGPNWPDPTGASMEYSVPDSGDTSNNLYSNWHETNVSTYGDGDYGTPGAKNDDWMGPTAVTLSGLSARATSPALLVGGVLLLGAVIFWRRRRQ